MWRSLRHTLLGRPRGHTQVFGQPASTWPRMTCNSTARFGLAYHGVREAWAEVHPDRMCSLGVTILLLVCVCCSPLRTEWSRPTSECRTKLLPGRFIFRPTLQSFSGWQPQNSKPSRASVYAPFQSPAFVGNVCISLSVFPLKTRNQHCCSWHLDIPRKATLNFCQVQNASNNQVFKEVSSEEW